MKVFSLRLSAELPKGLAVYEGMSLRTRRYRAGANEVRDAALRRPTKVERCPCLCCSRRGGFPFDFRWAEGKGTFEKPIVGV